MTVRTEIRHATPRDAGAVADVHVRSWAATYPPLLPAPVAEFPTVDTRIEQWREWLAPGSSITALVATREGGVAGFATIGASPDDDLAADVGEIAALYVDPAFQGTGVGRALTNTAIVELARNGFSSVTLWVLAANARARGFYAAAGFAPDGGERTYGRLAVPEYRYRLSLSDDQAGS